MAALLDLTIRIGTAGWSIPPQHAAEFAPGESHLHRYAGRFQAVEINSSFYRPHQQKTYARWAASVPEGFRFAVKMPKAITHESRLVLQAGSLAAFLDQIGGLGDRLGPILVQLPPSLAFVPDTAVRFLEQLRGGFDGLVAFEPRHAAWFTGTADALLAGYRVARVAADPACVPTAARPGGWTGLAYYRLHGTPQMYYSSYGDAYLEDLAGALRAPLQGGTIPWCIFDNTARGAAAGNAFTLQELLEKT